MTDKPEDACSECGGPVGPSSPLALSGRCPDCGSYGQAMTDKHTPDPKWFITELNDGIQWLTDGHDFGMYPGAAPELLKALETGLKAIPQPQPTRRGVTETGQRIIAWKEQARAAIKAAKGDA